jgi:hypothetical protein
MFAITFTIIYFFYLFILSISQAYVAKLETPTIDSFEVTFCGPKIVLLTGLSESKIKNDILLVLTLLFSVLSLLNLLIVVLFLDS